MNLTATHLMNLYEELRAVRPAPTDAKLLHVLWQCCLDHINTRLDAEVASQTRPHMGEEEEN